MEIPDELLALFTADIESRGGNPVIRVPDHELRQGALVEGGSYRIAVLPPADEQAIQQGGTGSDPPVDVGETLDVEIEDLGEKGDGIARIGPGYVIFVPETDIGDRVTIEITEARENFAFGTVTSDGAVT